MMKKVVCENYEVINDIYRNKILNIFFRIDAYIRKEDKDNINEQLDLLKDSLENFGYHHDIEYREIESFLYQSFHSLLKKSDQQDYSNLLNKFIHCLGIQKQKNFKTNINYQFNIIKKRKSLKESQFYNQNKDKKKIFK